MIYTSKDNWYSWTYGKLDNFSRQSGVLEFKTDFGPLEVKALSFKEELRLAATSSLDFHPGLKPAVLFSGGADSDVMLRAYLDIGVMPDIYIFRYENDYNIYDVSYAITICTMLGVEYNLIDFNLQKFYENDADRISELAQIDRAMALPYCKFLETVDGLPVMGASDLSLVRTDADYTRQGTWMLRCWEHDIGWSKFLREINKPGIAEWFKWTPGLVQSFLQLEWCKKLIADQYYGKLGTNSTKLIGYREAYPDLITRTKQTGFEKIDALISEFESHLFKKYNGFPYRNFYDRPVDDILKRIL
jgi:hypothetical protein